MKLPIALLAVCLMLLSFASSIAEVKEQPRWKKHVVTSGTHTATAVAADFTGDGKTDVISFFRKKARLFVAPDWKEVELYELEVGNCIHSEIMDVDGDGDMDYIGARYKPGLIFWLERPEKPLVQKWSYHLVDDKVIGIHGLITGDVNRDGKLDLLANSAQPTGDFPNSLVWFSVPKNSRAAPRWERHVFADKDAPGLSHYLGFGDVNGDDRPDAAAAAKGGPTAEPGTGDWFAWWEAPTDSTGVWQKHLIADKQQGATNIHPADVNGDGKTDFIASRGHGRGVLWFEAPNWKLHDINPDLKSPHCLTIADFDQDGDIDAATCAYESRIAAWFENDGKGAFKTHILDEDQAAYDIRSVDMDSDGDLDILIAGQRSKNVVWYENP